MKTKEYNPPKSARQPKWLKMYAELTRRTSVRSRWIKSLCDNKLKEYFEARATTGYTYILDHCLFGKQNCRTVKRLTVIKSGNIGEGCDANTEITQASKVA